MRGAVSRDHVAEVPGTVPTDLRTTSVAGVPCVVTTLDDAVDWLLSRIANGRGAVSVRLVNAYSIVSAHQNTSYLQLMRESGLSFPDGAPVTFAMRHLQHERGAGRVRGPSFFVRTLERSSEGTVRHFFLGATDATLEELGKKARNRWPHLAVAGTYAPPFSPITDEFIEDCRARVAAAAPDCVWVALGTPKQDFVAERLAQALDLPCIAVGAAVDFLAGTKSEAPLLMQAVGFEWLYRLATEPRRLWRRYLIGNVQFLLLLLQRPEEGRQR